ncbi:hypothetical protein AB0D62_16235 [Streptomyces massasporeus]
MLMIGGILDIMRGIAEIADDDIFVSTRNYVFEFNPTAWRWIHLALGVLAFVVSFVLFMASTWARVLGVGIAALVILSNFLSLPYYTAPEALWDSDNVAGQGSMSCWNAWPRPRIVHDYSAPIGAGDSPYLPTP